MATKYITYTYPLLFPASLLLGSMLAKYTDCVDGGYMIFVGGGFGLLLVGAWFAVSHQLIASELLFLLPLALWITRRRDSSRFVCFCRNARPPTQLP